MKKIVLLSFLFHHVLVFGYEINYTRTYNKIAAEQRDLKLHISEDGTATVSLPSFSTSPPINFTSPLKQSNGSLELMVDSLLAKKNSSLSRKLELLKNKQPNLRFYSSDVDQYNIEITQNGEAVFKMKFSNWQELKYYYFELGEWQPLVDLVEHIQNQIIATKMIIKNGEE